MSTDQMDVPYMQPLFDEPASTPGRWLTNFERLQIAVLAAWTSLTLFTPPTFSSLALLVYLFFLWLGAVGVAVWYFFRQKDTRPQALRVFLTLPLSVTAVLILSSFAEPPIAAGSLGTFLFALGATAYPAYLFLRWLWRSSKPAGSSDTSTAPTPTPAPPRLLPRTVATFAGLTLLSSLYLASVFLGLITPGDLAAAYFESQLNATAVICAVTTVVAVPFCLMRLIRGGSKGIIVGVVLSLTGAWLALALIFFIIVIGVGTS